MLYQPPQPQFTPPAPVKATSVLPTAALSQRVSDEVNIALIVVQWLSLVDYLFAGCCTFKCATFIFSTLRDDGVELAAFSINVV